MTDDEALEKLLALTKSYTRTSRSGRPQQVRQYPTPHPGHLNPSAAVLGKLPKVQTDWHLIKAGAIVDFGGEPWKVLAHAVNPPGKASSTGGVNSTGKGVRTGAPKNTGRKGRGLNTKGGVMSNSPRKPGAADKIITHVLENLWTGKRVQISLNAAYKVWVY